MKTDPCSNFMTVCDLSAPACVRRGERERTGVNARVCTHAELFSSCECVLQTTCNKDYYKMTD